MDLNRKYPNLDGMIVNKNKSRLKWKKPKYRSKRTHFRGGHIRFYFGLFGLQPA